MKPGRLFLHVLLCLSLLAVPMPAAGASTDVRQNEICQEASEIRPWRGCATASLAGTPLGCSAGTCTAAFTLDVEVDGFLYCGIAGATVTAPYSHECNGIDESGVATGTVTYAEGDAIVVGGLICMGFLGQDQACILYEETFQF